MVEMSERRRRGGGEEEEEDEMTMLQVVAEGLLELRKGPWFLPLPRWGQTQRRSFSYISVPVSAPPPTPPAVSAPLMSLSSAAAAAPAHAHTSAPTAPRHRKKSRILQRQPCQTQRKGTNDRKRKLTAMVEELSAENQDLKQQIVLTQQNMEKLKTLKHSLQHQLSQRKKRQLKHVEERPTDFMLDLNSPPPEFEMENETSKWI